MSKPQKRGHCRKPSHSAQQHTSECEYCTTRATVLPSCGIGQAELDPEAEQAACLRWPLLPPATAACCRRAASPGCTTATGAAAFQRRGADRQPGASRRCGPLRRGHAPRLCRHGLSCHGLSRRRREDVAALYLLPPRRLRPLMRPAAAECHERCQPHVFVRLRHQRHSIRQAQRLPPRVRRLRRLPAAPGEPSNSMVKHCICSPASWLPLSAWRNCHHPDCPAGNVIWTPRGEAICH